MGRRVLVVDDEPDIRDLVVIWLEDDPRCDGIYQAGDLDDAINKVKAEIPDSILLDFKVGARTADEVLPVIRAACPHARIIVHTASRDAALAADVLELGADHLLEKAAVSLAATVEALLD
jgi:DNA-binding NarL/FixJ family response regulator